MQTMINLHAKSSLVFALGILSIFILGGCNPGVTVEIHDRSEISGAPDAGLDNEGFVSAIQQFSGGAIVVSDDFNHGLDKWVVEQMPGGSVKAEGGVLTIHDAKGCTVWLKQKLTAPVAICYEVTMSSDARVSDMNCFWMASDPENPADLFYKDHGRTGKFSTYDTLNLYYVGYGGNANSTTRFRRYDGTHDRPILPENDHSEPELMLKAGHAYKIVLIAQNGVARFICDGRAIFSYKDAAPLTEGWFGLRTVNSKMLIKKFHVVNLASAAANK